MCCIGNGYKPILYLILRFSFKIHTVSHMQILLIFCNARCNVFEPPLSFLELYFYYIKVVKCGITGSIVFVHEKPAYMRLRALMCCHGLSCFSYASCYNMNKAMRFTTPGI